MKKVVVNLPGQSHPIWIGNSILEKAGALLEPMKFGNKVCDKSGDKFESKSGKTSGNAFVIIDSRLKTRARPLLQSLKKAGWKTTPLFVQAGESLKDIRKVYPIYGELLKKGADRESVLFAFGGGVIGDVTGFVAGTYLRGISWVGVPTTFVSQVDSCLGGKTGINHKAGKNLIGVIHQPSAVICDVGVLKTLPLRERVSGLGEIIKIGLTLDPGLYRSLSLNWMKLLARGSEPYAEAWIESCLRWKSHIVKQDVQDTRGIRNILNFGHTMGHALEAETQYEHFKHGEAVILGMRAATYLSMRKGYLKLPEHRRIDQLLAAVPVPLIPKKIKNQSLVNRLQWDKKARNKKPCFVLLKGIGRTVSDSNVETSHIFEALEWIRG